MDEAWELGMNRVLPAQDAVLGLLLLVLAEGTALESTRAGTCLHS